jgi:hypothetical protein
LSKKAHEYALDLALRAEEAGRAVNRKKATGAIMRELSVSKAAAREALRNAMRLRPGRTRWHAENLDCNTPGHLRSE